MRYKVIESPGFEIEAIDDAAFNWFASDYRDGIIANVLDECIPSVVSSSSIRISPGEFMMCGFRVKILDPVYSYYSHLLSGSSTSTRLINITAELEISPLGTAYFSFSNVFENPNPTPTQGQDYAAQAKAAPPSNIHKYGHGHYSLPFATVYLGSDRVQRVERVLPVFSKRLPNTFSKDAGKFLVVADDGSIGLKKLDIAEDLSFG